MSKPDERRQILFLSAIVQVKAHLLECAPVSHCMQPAHTNAPKALALSTTAFSSCLKIFHMKHVKHVPLSFLWREEAGDYV